MSQETEPRPRNWVWFSTRESIAAGTWSVTAILETILAMALYPYLALTFHTYALWLASLAIAPLVLLRSEESVALGLRWFMRWKEAVWDDDGAWEDLPAGRRRLVWTVCVTAVLASFILAFAASGYLLPGHEGWSAFWRGSLISSGAVAAAGALAGALVGARGGVAAAMAAAVAGVTAVAVTGAAAAVAAGAAASVTAVAVAVTGAAAGALAGARGGVAAAMAAAVIGAAAPFLVPLALGMGCAVLAITLTIRIAATLRHVRLGMRALPNNFRRLVFCTSPLREPELMPGLHAHEEFVLAGLSSSVRSHLRSGDILGRVVALSAELPLVVLWFLPGWLYGFTLKSTAWFWGPLVYLGGPPVPDADDPVLTRRLAFGTLWGWASVAMAVTTILAWLVLNLPWTRVLFHHDLFLTPIGFLWIVDWSAQYPWQILSLLVALISLGTVVWMNYAGVIHDHGSETGRRELLARAGWHFAGIRYLKRLRLLLQVPFWMLVGGHLVLFANAWSCWFEPPAFLTRAAAEFYGQRAPKACLDGRSVMKALLLPAQQQ